MGKPGRDELAEIVQVRRAMREFARFSALPATWVGLAPERVVASFAEALGRVLACELAYVVLWQPGSGIVDALAGADGALGDPELERVRAALTPVLGHAAPPPAAIPAPLGDGTLRIDVIRCGTGKDSAALVAGSRRPDFPTAEERLFLDVAGHHLADVCRERRDFDATAVLAAIVESSKDAVISKTLEGVITSWNRGAEEVFGYGAAETIGRSIEMLIPEDRRAEERHILERVRSGERIDHYETVRVPKDGRRIDVAMTLSPIHDESGRIIGASKIARDITARVRSEREQAGLLAREQEALREARLLNDLARTLGAELDLDRLVQGITDTGTELTGARFGAFFYNITDESGEGFLLYTLSGAPKSAFEQFGLPRNTPIFGPTFRGEGPIRIDDVLADPRYGQNAPHRGMPPGHLPVRSYLGVPVVARSGDVLGGLFFGHPSPGVFTERAERLALGVAAQAAICVDNAQLYRTAQRQIADRAAAEQRERAARQDAERATRMRDDFLATVSHELRTPLNSILGWSQLLQKSGDDPEIRRQAFDAIERGARAQARLVEDLLDVSRIISGKLRLDVQTVELVTIIHAAIETIRPAAEAKSIRIERVLDPLAGPIKGDPARLQQIVWNLLSNAVKFTERGGRAQVHVERVNSHVEISVSDNGRGISPELLPYVFDRFWQADTSTTRSYAGLGLGLAVVKHLAELHGGKVFARSPGEGKGATFTVHLPTAIVQQELEGREHPVTSRLAGEVESAASLADVKVLVVDDDSDACEILRRVLQERGARVETALSGRDALRRLDEFKPHVILSDIGMPEMDGYELIREIRRRGSNVPAVAVTAFGRSEDRVRSLRAGYHMHMAKPLEPRELVEVVASLVRSDSPSAKP